MIQPLGPTDRRTVLALGSRSTRVFPLRCYFPRPRLARPSRSDTCIPRSRHDPKILWVDDAKIVGDRIAEIGPVAGNFFAQETERRIGELGASCVGFVVRDVSVHDAP